MPRRKQSRPSPSNKGRGPNNRSSNRHSHASPATPTSGRRGKAQRLLLLGDDFDLDPFDDPGRSSGHRKFTLQQEARNTEAWGYRRNDDKKLRQLGITFVRPQQDEPASETRDDARPPRPHPLLETAPREPEPPTVDASPQPAASFEVSSHPQSGASSHLKTPDESSSSAEEEVVFIPRNQRRPNINRPKPQEDSKTHNQVPDETYDPASSPSRKPNPPKETLRRQHRSDFRATNDEEDEILADYIQNLEENGEDLGDIFSLRPLGNHLDDIDSGDEDAPQRPFQSDQEINEPGIYVDINVAAVIGKRNGQLGTEYQFKPAGSTLAEALWLEGTDMTRDIQHLIDHFEAGLDDAADFGSASEDSDVQSSDGHGDLDQKLAKMLQFEEDDDDDDDGKEEDDDAEDLLKMMLGKPNKQGIFPRAFKLADDYGDFDIMSRERASLSDPFNRKSRKANIGRFSRETIDAELDDEEAELHIELENYILQDREKKKIRKQEREVRRQGGMLGTSSMLSNPTSMDIKNYAAGISINKVHVSIKKFLMSGVAERLSLPPMHKQDRLEIHILAHKFFMQSKSQGKGNNRFPVLYKTKQTRLFEGDEVAIDRVLSTSGERNSRGKFVKFRNRVARQPSAGSGGGGGIIHQDGMIVGTGAAELGQGNKGFEMLSKMGWTTGTGLGSGRSGILDPVQAIVKNSRAGLG